MHYTKWLLLSSLLCLSLCNPVVDPAASYIRNYSFRFTNAVQNTTVYFCWGSNFLGSAAYAQFPNIFSYNTLETTYNYTLIQSVSPGIQAYYDQCNSTQIAEILFDEIGETGYYELSFIGAIGNESIQAVECDFSQAPYYELWKYRIINQVTCNNQLIELPNVTVQYADGYSPFQIDLPAATPNRSEISYYVSNSNQLLVSGAVPGYANFSFSYFVPNNKVGTIFLYGDCSNVRSAALPENPKDYSCNTPATDTNDDSGNGWLIALLCIGWILAIVLAVILIAVVYKLKASSRKNEAGMQYIDDPSS